MIEEIGIRGLGVIGEATLPLGRGFTALTGETGAGKTMVVTAVGLLLGERSDAGVIRAGADRASVEARWLVPAAGVVADRVQDAGGSVEELGDGSAELLVSRTIAAEGRSRAAVGGRSAPAALLAELAEHLVVVHGQSDQIRLRSAAAQREALDRFAAADLDPVLTKYQSAHRRFTEGRDELDRLVADRDQRSAEADELREQLAEIEVLAPQPGELDELQQRADRLSNAEELRLAAAEAHEMLSSESVDEERDVLTLLAQARRALERAASLDPELAALAEQVDALAYQASDAATGLAGYAAGFDLDSARELETVQTRIAELTLLTRKYGPTLEDCLRFFDEGSARLLELDTDTDRIDALRHDVAADETVTRELADEVSAIRQAAGAQLSERVSAELAALAMPDAQLIVDVRGREDFTAFGRDAVQFLLQPHPGGEPRPLGRGASGGELSRIMLAIEVVLAAGGSVPTFVFDEVDAGVGGAAAIEIGRRLARLAESAQVIVVTHLAQVAAFATNHLRVEKDRSGAVTESSVRRLDGDERVAEMARLLSGLPDSATGLAHAQELLELAVPAAAPDRNNG
ncbi:DNA repair protein RecN [Herbiconiux sp. L3-i23]|uniref:DNA repair protein RecN n=1 Tax=Herbiconiux sp. L3-i23 TaxID=2905871 RepID=UPI00206C54C6|nr:DNA repair protein RecN [Herbiconiux sp. L3-i23]BDI22264.1 DNA repair protein RecN [Herbiconiux sp. L3-i23]